MPLIPFEVSPTAIAGLFVVTTKQISDERGTVREFFRTSDFAAAGLPIRRPWAQVNLTATRHGGVRGLHGEAMCKYVSVAVGEAFGAYLDARRDSASFGEVVTVELHPGTGVFVSEGICNGFQAVALEPTEYLYCFDEEWQPDMPGVQVNAFDPDLGIDWPVAIDLDDRSLISAKDAALPKLRELSGG